MKMGEKGLALVKSFEGLCLNAYKCPANVWTIGYGHTGTVDGKPIKAGMKITNDKATELLRKDVSQFEKAVKSYVKVKINQNQFDALVSFAFNVGAGALQGSTILKMINQRKFISAARHFLDWNKARVNGKLTVLNGLTARREAEAALFSTGIPTSSSYKLDEFVKDLQKIKSKKVTGVPNNKLLSAMPDISTNLNAGTLVIKPLKKYLKKLGYFTGTVNSKYDTKLSNAIKKYKIAKKMNSKSGTISVAVWKKLLKL